MNIVSEEYLFVTLFYAKIVFTSGTLIDVITSFLSGYMLGVGRVRTGTAQASDAGCPI